MRVGPIDLHAEHRASGGRAGRGLAIVIAIAALGTLSACKPARGQPGEGVPPPAGFRSELASTNGIRMHYLIGGQGDPLLLLHGWPHTWFEWHRIMPQLAQRYTVIVPDLRGAGGTDAPPTTTGYDKETMAEDLRGLLDHLGVGAAHVAAHDIGVMVAYPLAAKYPTRVKKLVLAEAPIPGVDPGWSTARSVKYLWHFGFHEERDTPELLVAGRERPYLVSFFQKFAVKKDAFTEEEIDEYVRAYSRPGRMTAGFEWYRAFDTDAGRNRELQKSPLPMPVLMVGGGGFGTTEADLVAQGKVIATEVRGAVIPGSGHWLLEEAPDLFLAELRAFLGPTD